jgi:hypothetical protein
MTSPPPLIPTPYIPIGEVMLPNGSSENLDILEKKKKKKKKKSERYFNFPFGKFALQEESFIVSR